MTVVGIIEVSLTIMMEQELHLVLAYGSNHNNKNSLQLQK